MCDYLYSSAYTPTCLPACTPTCSPITCEQVMLAVRFCPSDAKDRRCQAWVCRRLPNGKKHVKTPTDVSVASMTTVLSPLTTSCASNSTIGSPNNSKVSGRKKTASNPCLRVKEKGEPQMPCRTIVSLISQFKNTKRRPTRLLPCYMQGRRPRIVACPYDNARK